MHNKTLSTDNLLSLIPVTLVTILAGGLRHNHFNTFLKS